MVESQSHGEEDLGICEGAPVRKMVNAGKSMVNTGESMMVNTGELTAHWQNGNVRRDVYPWLLGCGDLAWNDTLEHLV